MTTRRSIIYKTASGVEPYTQYVDALKDRLGAVKIKVRMERAVMGALGDYRSVGRGVIELRVDWGPGYRVYVGVYGQEAIVLLCAGDKSSQWKDIQRAHVYWKDFKNQP